MTGASSKHGKPLVVEEALNGSSEHVHKHSGEVSTGLPSRWEQPASLPVLMVEEDVNYSWINGDCEWQ